MVNNTSFCIHWNVINKKKNLFSDTDTTPNSPYIAQELTLLTKALKEERTERIKLQSVEMAKVLSNLKPIYVPQLRDNRITELEKDLMKVKHVRFSRVQFQIDININFQFISIF